LFVRLTDGSGVPLCEFVRSLRLEYRLTRLTELSEMLPHFTA
jgi:hypothetical protein